ncbi:MAG: hypothetical protein AAGA18_12360 [Verrucomicrobiota bacterium]
MQSVKLGMKSIEIGIPNGNYPGLSHYFEHTKLRQHHTCVLELQDNWGNLLRNLNGFGPLLTVSTSSSVVSTKIYEEVYFNQLDASVYEIDGCHELRPDKISSVLVAQEHFDKQILLSIQFYDPKRRGFLKLCLTLQSDLKRFHEWIEESFANKSPLKKSKMPVRKLKQKSSYQQDLAAHSKRADSPHSMDVSPICCPLLIELAKSQQIPLQFIMLTPAMRHFEVLERFDLNSSKEGFTLETEGLAISVQTSNLRRAALHRPVDGPSTPYALNLYEPCKCFHTVILPALHPSDERVTCWASEVEKLFINQ